MRPIVLPAALLALAACSQPETPAAADTAAPPADAPVTASAGDAVRTDPDATTPVERITVDASQTQCVSGETHLYSCPIGGRAVVSVCVGNRQVSYRYGPLGEPELDLTVRQGQPGVWQGGVVGQGGGQQNHIRFRSGGFDYIVFSGYAGSLAEDPTRRWSGVTVLRDGREIRRIDCPVRSSQTEIPASMIPDYVPAEPDDTADTFNAWY